MCQLSELWWHWEDEAHALVSSVSLSTGFSAVVRHAAHDPHVAELAARLDARVAALHAALPPGSLLLACSGQGNTALLRALQGEIGERWIRTKEERQALKAAIRASPAVRALTDHVAQGVLLQAVKQ